jgi:hypothetical protein
MIVTKKNEYADHYESPQQLVFGLGSAEIVEAEWRRLKLRMRSPEDVRAFLACTELAALDCIADCIVAQTNKEKCESLLKVFVLVRAPEAAEPMLQCKLSAKTPAIARDWLDKYVGNAVAGLIGVAGGRGKLAGAAIDYLRSVKRKGYDAVIATCVKQAGDSEAAAKVQADVLDTNCRSRSIATFAANKGTTAARITRFVNIHPNGRPATGQASRRRPAVHRFAVDRRGS